MYTLSTFDTTYNDHQLLLNDPPTIVDFDDCFGELTEADSFGLTRKTSDTSDIDGLDNMIDCITDEIFGQAAQAQYIAQPQVRPFIPESLETEGTELPRVSRFEVPKIPSPDGPCLKSPSRSSTSSFSELCNPPQRQRRPLGSLSVPGLSNGTRELSAAERRMADTKRNRARAKQRLEEKRKLARQRRLNEGRRASHYPERQVAAQERNRVGGRFGKEERLNFVAITELQHRE